MSDSSYQAYPCTVCKKRESDHEWTGYGGRVFRYCCRCFNHAVGGTTIPGRKCRPRQVLGCYARIWYPDPLCLRKRGHRGPHSSVRHPVLDRSS
jgi:hypothetical protein